MLLLFDDGDARNATLAKGGVRVRGGAAARGGAEEI